MNPIYKILRNYLNRTRFLDIKEIDDIWEYPYNTCCSPDLETNIEYITTSGTRGAIVIDESLASIISGIEERDAHDPS